MNRFLLICLFLLLVTGCVEQRIIDDIALLNAVAYDVSEENEDELKLTGTYPFINKDGKYDQEVITVTGKSSKSAREKLKRSSNLKLESGQLRVAVYSSELAGKGLNKLLDTFPRDPNIGSRVHLAVIKGKAGDAISIPIKHEGQNATFLEQFITKLNEESAQIDYNIFQYFRDFYDDGVDPILPVFKIKNEKIKYDGMALFKGDKLIHMLNPKDTKILLFLKDDVKSNDLDLEIKLEDKKETIMLSYVKSKHHVEVMKASEGQKKAIIHLSMSGDVFEYTGEADLSDPKIQDKAKKLISEQLDKSGNKLIKRIQELGVDSLGMGAYTRNKMDYKDWKKLNWSEAYKEMEVEVKTEVEFNNIGKWK